MNTNVTIDPAPSSARRLPHLPHPSRTRPRRWRWVALALALALPLLAGGFGLWWFVLRHDAPAAVSLDSALDGITAPSTQAAAGTAGTAAASAASQVSGTWNVDTTVANASGTGSFAGFRVNEELVGIGAATAVGRSSAVQGSITVDGTTVTAATFTADLTRITSNDSRRNGAIQNALATGRYPMATFVLTQPIQVGRVPAGGERISVAATGDLTVHGVTRSVTIDLDAQLSDGVLVVVGSAPVSFADYGVRAPTAPIVASVDDNGTMEFQFYLAKS